MRNFVGMCFVCLGVTGCSANPEAVLPASPAVVRTLRDVVGAPARVVWVQDRGSGEDLHQSGRQHALMAFDTVTGRIRELVPAIDQINKPLIAPGGDYVVFSRRRDDSIHRVAWTGGAPVRIGAGFALAVWRDPRTGVDWLYAAVDRSRNEDAPYRRIVRHPVGDPSRVEEVWNGGDVSLDSVHISRDGTRIGGMFPWPRGMIINAANRRAEMMGRGCWTSLAPDNSYILWIFDGAHRNLFLHSPDGRMRWRVPINTIPNGAGRKMYHPRWSNHVRFLVATGPYNTEGGRLSVRGGAQHVEVWVGRFDERLSSIEAWARVTENEVGDYAPDLWVAGGETSEVPSTVFAPSSREIVQPELDTRWPGTEEGLVFVWSHANVRNEVADGRGGRTECTVEPLRGARWSPFHGMDIRKGSFVAPNAGPRIVEACRRSNELTIEATLLPRSAALTGPARIIALSKRIGEANFMLGQERDRLVLRLRTPETGSDGTANDSQTDLGRIEPGRRIHVIVSYQDGELAAYLDGRPYKVPQRIRGSFDTWDIMDLRFGDESSHDRTWDGEIDGVAIWSRFVGPEEATRRFELNRIRTAGRLEPRTLEFRARLVEATPVPDPREIAPYRRALALCEYELDAAESPVDGSQRIHIYHWVILDAAVVPDAIPQKGEPVVLRVQRVEENPPLESERRLIGIESIGLPEFVDVSR